jgi:ATP-dependent protease ClpP protease subunit
MSKPPACIFTGQGCAPLGIHLYGEIDDDNAAAFAEALRWAESRLAPGCVMPLFVSSMGGDIYCAMQICDLVAGLTLKMANSMLL